MTRNSPETSNMTPVRVANTKRSIVLELARDWVRTGTGQEAVLAALREWVGAEAKCGQGRT